MNNQYGIRSLISEEKKLVLLWTPKAGCTTTKNIFYNYIGIEVPENNKFIVNDIEWIEEKRKQQEFLPENPKDYLILQFCRNPYYRAISSFLTHIEHNLRPEHHPLGRCQENFPTFIDFLLAIKNQKVTCIHCKYHSSIQYMTDKINDIVKIENLDDELQRINNLYTLNLTNITYKDHSYQIQITENKFPKIYCKPYQDYLDKDAILLIEEIYSKDIEFFRYGYTK